MRSKHWMLVFVLMGLIEGAATQAQAQAIRGSRTVSSPLTVRETTEPSITFLTADLLMEGEDLGNPGYIGTFNSHEATIEMTSNVGLRMNYTTGSNMETDHDTLPTTFQFYLRGHGQIGTGSPPSEEMFGPQTGYGGAIAVDPDDSGYVAFNPNDLSSNSTNPVSGFKSRVAIERSGLNDHAGEYSTQITLTWSVF